MANEVHRWRGTTGDSLAPGNWDTDGPATQATGTGTFAKNKATSSLVFSANPVDAETVTIGSTVYTFKDTTAAAFDVKIGGTTAASIDNLDKAIDADGVGDGTDYHTGTTAHPDVTATNTDTTLMAEARVGGTAGNSIVTDEGLTNGSWSSGTLVNGTDNVTSGDTITIDAQVYRFVTSLAGCAANDVLIGAALTDSRDNFLSAIAATAADSGVKWCAGTAKNSDVTAAANGTLLIDLTSIKYGTDQNAIATTDVGTTFSWGGGTLSGALTDWATDGTVEVIFEEDQNQAFDTNMDWAALLGPSIGILRVTKKINNATLIGTSGSPWKYVGVVSDDCIMNLQGFGDCYIKAVLGNWIILQDLVGKLDFSGLTGVVKFMEIHSGICDCNATFSSGSGGLGTRVQVTGESAVLNLLGTTLRMPGLLVIEAGIVTNERDMAVGDWVFIGERGTMIDKGKHDSQHDGIVPLGIYRSIPRAENPADGLSVYGGYSAVLDFADANYVVNIQNGVIGRNSEFNQGRVSNVLASMLDLRETYP